MRRIGWSVLIAALVFAVADAVYPQEIPATYTVNPDRYSVWMELRAKASWLLELWENPTETMDKQKAKVEEWVKNGRDPDPLKQPEALKYLGLQDYEVDRKAAIGDVALRTLVAQALVADAEWDPIFAAILKIQRRDSADRAEPIQAIQLLVDSLGNINGDYPVAFSALRDVVSERLGDQRAGVRFVAINGVAALPESYRTKELIAKVAAMLEDKDQVLVAEAARVLGELGVREAVKPLMEKFNELPEGTDPTSDESSSSAEPLNQVRLSIALAVSKITSNDWGLNRQINKAGILESYKAMAQWWDANKGAYD